MGIEKVDCDRLIEAIRDISGYNFEQYSEKSFMRRIEKILSDYKLDIDQLVERMADDSTFVERIVKDITVNTTEIFRDTAILDVLPVRRSIQL